MKAAPTINLCTEDPFARVNKLMLEGDSSLSWKAKGILAYLLGKPSNWILRIEDICNHAADGRAAVVAGIRELRKAGYVKLEQVRAEGKISAWRYSISDRPRFKETNDKEALEVENQLIESRSLSKNDRTKKVTGTKKEPIAVGGASAPPARARIEPSAPKPKTEEEIAKEKHGQFIALFVDAYKERFGEPYSFQGGKDGKAVKELLATTGLEPDYLVSIARQAWERAGQFPFDSSLSICGFNSKINEIRGKLQVNGNGCRVTRRPESREAEEKIEIQIV